MHLEHDIAPLRERLQAYRRAGHRIALVPTMGNLHEGHLTLIDRARELADIVVATLFVNPLQFAAGEDFGRYPRTLESDRQQLTARGCDLLFAPAVDTLYPHGLASQTQVHVPDVSEGLCGGSRIGHFDGVATVVSLLFHLVQPDIACFGEKDFQQLAVIRKLVADLHFPIEIVGVPTVRADDGLALSSRNGYLSAAERELATMLYRTLGACRDAIERGDAAENAIAEAARYLEANGLKLDYLELRRPDLKAFDPAEDTTGRLLGAVYLGTTRLIDNVAISVSTAQGRGAGEAR
ncbi:pantoate--beta-alanine ligase [Salinicola rhizosphaerae]|uniref:Pantothenate synthetase n=1 Tax=Salinicola rhizosphaerae TaxID=1443141 RepID=A0ABQ3DVQ7_9GAMM|nr:pantoate--beta-alanine ligase [Salinicola rhizosphaerae]GHB15272.1 pantothenate synthetase [Salinicola rhizosphaerae]